MNEDERRIKQNAPDKTMDDGRTPFSRLLVVDGLLLMITVSCRGANGETYAYSVHMTSAGAAVSGGPQTFPGILGQKMVFGLSRTAATVGSEFQVVLVIFCGWSFVTRSAIGQPPWPFSKRFFSGTRQGMCPTGQVVIRDVHGCNRTACLGPCLNNRRCMRRVRNFEKSAGDDERPMITAVTRGPGATV